SSGCIGRHDRDLGAPANYFKGAIDDFRYWNRELTVDNIAELLGLNYNVSNMTTSTSCGSNDGTITISGLTSGNNYTITYIHNSVTETLSMTADASGNYIITGLESGIYNSILVTENVTGCQDDLGQVIVECFDQGLPCFKTKLVFTPNGDAINDYWNLIISSNACDYIVYIYDRYGKLLKTLSPENNKWDGTSRGYNLPSNDYWYVVEYKIDDKKY